MRSASVADERVASRLVDHSLSIPAALQFSSPVEDDLMTIGAGHRSHSCLRLCRLIGGNWLVSTIETAVKVTALVVTSEVSIRGDDSSPAKITVHDLARSHVSITHSGESVAFVAHSMAS